MLNPRSRVVSDDVVRASRGLQVGVPADNGGLPGLVAADVSMRGPASCSGGRGDPVVPAVTDGVAQRVGGGGSGVVRLLRVLAETLQQVFAAGACCAEQLRGGSVTSAKPGLCGGGLRGAESGKGAVACANDCAEDMSDSRALYRWAVAAQMISRNRWAAGGQGASGARAVVCVTAVIRHGAGPAQLRGCAEPARMGG